MLARFAQGVTAFGTPANWVVIAHRFLGDTLYLRVRAGEARLAVRLRLGPKPALLAVERNPARLKMPVVAHHWWDLRADHLGGVFACARDFVRGALRGRSSPVAAAAGSVQVAMALSHLRALATEALSRCDPHARDLAMRFRGSTRFWVYQQVMNDRTGHIAQLADSCPGLLVLTDGFAWEDGAGRDAAREILRAVIAGRPLRAILADAIEHWSRLASLACEPWRDADPKTRSSPPALMASKRLHVRRARACVRSSDLMSSPPFSFAPEDIPRDTYANAIWYEVARYVQCVLAREADWELRLRTSRFLCRHAVTLFKGAHRRAVGASVLPRTVAETTRRTLAYAKVTGHMPTCRSSPRRYLERAQRWQAGCAFPPGPDSPSIHGLHLEPIRSAERLEREGSEMRHCVAQLLSRVLAGDVHIYSSDGPLWERLTVAVVRGDDGAWEVEDARGVGDRSLTTHEEALVAQWVQALNEGRAETSVRTGAD
jgi:hypothetical protein